MKVFSCDTILLLPTALAYFSRFNLRGRRDRPTRLASRYLGDSTCPRRNFSFQANIMGTRGNIRFITTLTACSINSNERVIHIIMQGVIFLRGSEISRKKLKIDDTVRRPTFSTRL